MEMKRLAEDRGVERVGARHLPEGSLLKKKKWYNNYGIEWNKVA